MIQSEIDDGPFLPYTCQKCGFKLPVTKAAVYFEYVGDAPPSPYDTVVSIKLDMLGDPDDKN